MLNVIIFRNAEYNPLFIWKHEIPPMNKYLLQSLSLSSYNPLEELQPNNKELTKIEYGYEKSIYLNNVCI
jgi:hypothetical protein